MLYGKKFVAILKWFLYCLFAALLFSLLPTKVYNQKPTKPFSGNKWHNPYKELNQLDENWQYGNFHAHGEGWFFSNGHGSEKELATFYLDSLGYDWAGISNYQKISRHNYKGKLVSVYEHGYGLGKQHQLVLGSTKESWFDFPFIQFSNQKQTVLDKLQAPQNLLVLAHPKLRLAYTLEDVQQLGGYDCMEVLNHIGRSRDHWDAALSAGIPVYLISSDDTHDYEDLHKTGQNITVFKTRHDGSSGVIAALKSGHAYGVDLRSGVKAIKERRKEIETLAQLIEQKLRSDTLMVSFNKTFSYLKFVGQGGKLLAECRGGNKAFYTLQPHDTYVRVVAHFEDPSAHIYLNPVFRYSQTIPINSIPPLNARQTRVYRLSILYLILGLLGLIWQVEVVGRKRSKKGTTKIRWAIP